MKFTRTDEEKPFIVAVKMGHLYVYNLNARTNKNKRDITELQLYRLEMWNVRCHRPDIPPARRPLTPFDKTETPTATAGPVYMKLIYCLQKINFADYIIIIIIIMYNVILLIILKIIVFADGVTKTSTHARCRFAGFSEQRFSIKMPLLMWYYNT